MRAIALPIRRASSDDSLLDAEAVALRVITAIEPCQGHAVGVLDHVALGIFPDQRPGRLETAA